MVRKDQPDRTTPDRLAVACVTTSRADYGLLRGPMRGIAAAPDMVLKVVAGGGHLAPSQGMTAAEIERDGLVVDFPVELLLDTASDTGIATGIGLATIGFATAFRTLRPDWVMLLGDRFEILGAATAALVLRIPLCHLCGGDVTEGAYDDAVRHAVSKLAHLHCVTNATAARRLLQLGEEPWRVVETGSPGIDALLEAPPLTRAEVLARIGIADCDRPGSRALLVTYHPVTLAADDGVAGIETLLTALGTIENAIIVFTGVNANSGNHAIRERISAFVAAHPGATMRQNLGGVLYANALRSFDAVIGNSSSGLYEAPTFGTPTVNIGSRQHGRLKAPTVIDCDDTLEAITAAIAASLRRGRRPGHNPYGDGSASPRIVDALRMAAGRGDSILKKRFIDHPLDQPATA